MPIGVGPKKTISQIKGERPFERELEFPTVSTPPGTPSTPPTGIQPQPQVPVTPPSLEGIRGRGGLTSALGAIGGLISRPDIADFLFKMSEGKRQTENDTIFRQAMLDTWDLMLSDDPREVQAAQDFIQNLDLTQLPANISPDVIDRYMNTAVEMRQNTSAFQSLREINDALDTDPVAQNLALQGELNQSTILQRVLQMPGGVQHLRNIFSNTGATNAYRMVYAAPPSEIERVNLEKAYAAARGEIGANILASGNLLSFINFMGPPEDPEQLTAWKNMKAFVEANPAMPVAQANEIMRRVTKLRAPLPVEVANLEFVQEKIASIQTPTEVATLFNQTMETLGRTGHPLYGSTELTQGVATAAINSVVKDVDLRVAIHQAMSIVNDPELSTDEKNLQLIKLGLNPNQVFNAQLFDSQLRMLNAYSNVQSNMYRLAMSYQGAVVRNELRDARVAVAKMKALDGVNLLILDLNKWLRRKPNFNGVKDKDIKFRSVFDKINAINDSIGVPRIEAIFKGDSDKVIGLKADPRDLIINSRIELDLPQVPMESMEEVLEILRKSISGIDEQKDLLLRGALSEQPLEVSPTEGIPSRPPPIEEPKGEPLIPGIERDITGVDVPEVEVLVDKFRGENFSQTQTEDALRRSIAAGFIDQDSANQVLIQMGFPPLSR